MQLEESRLQWSDHTKWSLKRINSSQIVNGQAVGTVSQRTRLCRFYEDCSCSHTSHQGRSLTHPEVKCSLKLNLRAKDHTNSAR